MKQKIGKWFDITLDASGSIACFFFVLVWWTSGIAPVESNRGKPLKQWVGEALGNSPRPRASTDPTPAESPTHESRKSTVDSSQTSTSLSINPNVTKTQSYGNPQNPDRASGDQPRTRIIRESNSLTLVRGGEIPPPHLFDPETTTLCLMTNLSEKIDLFDIEGTLSRVKTRIAPLEPAGLRIAADGSSPRLSIRATFYVAELEVIPRRAFEILRSEPFNWRIDRRPGRIGVQSEDGDSSASVDARRPAAGGGIVRFDLTGPRKNFVTDPEATAATTLSRMYVEWHTNNLGGAADFAYLVQCKKGRRVRVAVLAAVTPCPRSETPGESPYAKLFTTTLTSDFGMALNGHLSVPENPEPSTDVTASILQARFLE